MCHVFFLFWESSMMFLSSSSRKEIRNWEFLMKTIEYPDGTERNFIFGNLRSEQNTFEIQTTKLRSILLFSFKMCGLSGKTLDITSQFTFQACSLSSKWRLKMSQCWDPTVSERQKCKSKTTFSRSYGLVCSFRPFQTSWRSEGSFRPLIFICSSLSFLLLGSKLRNSGANC